MRYSNFSFLLLLVLLAITSGCNRDYLDIKPKGKTIPSTYKDFRLILNNAYDLPTAYGNDEWATDDVEFYETQGLGYLSNAEYKLHTWQNNVYTASDDDDDWINLYKQVYLSNVVLEGMNTATGGAEKDRNQLIGEALVHRSYAYLSLVNLYAAAYDPATAATDPGIPLLLTPSISTKLDRASVKAVYDQVLDDLTKASTLLNTKSTSAFEPALPAAYALLARTCLFAGKYSDALNYASKGLALQGTLIDYNDFTADPSSTFPQNMDNPETILVKRASNSYRWFSISKDLQNVFKDPVSDLRYQILFTSTTDPFNGYLYYNAEFLSYDERNIGPTVPEMYLIRAECAARLGSPDNAMQDLNTLRIKRILKTAYAPVTAVSVDDALVKVLEERRREMCLRGVRLSDLKRLNKDPRFAKTLTHHYNGQSFEIKPNDYHYLLPIAPKLTALNPELTPNQRN